MVLNLELLSEAMLGLQEYELVSLKMMRLLYSIRCLTRLSSIHKGAGRRKQDTCLEYFPCHQLALDNKSRKRQLSLFYAVPKLFGLR